ncbi:hypothetical protein PRIPAC_75787, partial [Pristionchus pacificus]
FQMVRPSSQPSTSGSSVYNRLRNRVAGSSNLALHAQWMVHVKSCTVEDQTCSLSCNLQKAALLHMENCTNGSPCEFQYCDTTRNIVSHWQTCKQGKSCGICAPLLNTPYPLPSTFSQNSGKGEPPTVAELSVASFAKAVNAVNGNEEVGDAAAKKKKKKKHKSKIEPLTPASVAYAGWTPAHKRFVLLEHVIWCINDHKPGPRPLARFATPPYTRPTPVPPPCTYAHCAAMQELLDHCGMCTLNSGCNFAHCATTKFLIVHISRCSKTKECGFCNSLNKAMTEYDWPRRFQSVPPEIEEWSLKTDERRFLMKVKPFQYPGVSILDGYDTSTYPSKGPYDARQDALIRMVSWILETTIATQTMAIDHAGHCKDENCQTEKCTVMKQTLKHISTCTVERCSYDKCNATKTILFGWVHDGTAKLMPSLQYVINAYLPVTNTVGGPASRSTEVPEKQMMHPSESKIQLEKNAVIVDYPTTAVATVDGDSGKPYSSTEMMAMTDADSTAIVQKAHRLVNDMRTEVKRATETGRPTTTPKQRRDIETAVKECAEALRRRQEELKEKAAKSEERAKRRAEADAWKAEYRAKAEAAAVAEELAAKGDAATKKEQEEIARVQNEAMKRQMAELRTNAAQTDLKWFVRCQQEVLRRNAAAHQTMLAEAVATMPQMPVAPVSPAPEISEDEFARLQKRVQEEVRKGGFSEEEREFVMRMEQLPNANLPSKDNLVRCFREGSALAAAVRFPVPSDQKADLLRMMQEDMRSGGDNSFMHPNDLEKFLALQFTGSTSTAINGASSVVATITPELLARASFTSTAELIRRAQPDLPDEVLEDVTAAMQELMMNGRISEEWCRSHGFPNGSSNEFNSRIVKHSIEDLTRKEESAKSIEHTPGRRKSEGDQPEYLHLWSCPRNRSGDSEDRSSSPSYSHAEISLLMDPEQQERLLLAIANGDGQALELAGLKELAEAEGPRAAYERCHKVRMQMEVLKHTGDEAKLAFVAPMFNLLEHDVVVEGNMWKAKAKSENERKAMEALAKMEAEEEEEDDDETTTSDEEAEKEAEREERRLALQVEMDQEMVRELDEEQRAMDDLYLLTMQLASLQQIHEMAAGGIPLGALEEGIRDARRKIGAHPEPPTEAERTATTAHFGEAIARLGSCERTREMMETRKADEVYLHVRREQMRVLKRKMEKEQLTFDELAVCKARIQLAQAECGQRAVEVDTRHTDAPFVAEKWMAENLPGAEGKSDKEVRQMMDEYIEREQRRMDEERRRQVEESKAPIVKLLEEYLIRREADEAAVKTRQEAELDQEIQRLFKLRQEAFAKMDHKSLEAAVEHWLNEKTVIMRAREEQWKKEAVSRGHPESGAIVALLEFVKGAEDRLWSELNKKIGEIRVGPYDNEDDANDELAKQLIVILYAHIKSMGDAVQAEVEQKTMKEDTSEQQSDSDDDDDDDDDEDEDELAEKMFQAALMDLLTMKPNGNDPPIDLDSAGGATDFRARILSKAVDLEREQRAAKRRAQASKLSKETAAVARKASLVAQTNGFEKETARLEESAAKLIGRKLAKEGLKVVVQEDGDALAAELLGAMPADLQGALFRVMQAKLDGTDTPIDEREAELMLRYQDVDEDSNEAADIRKEILMNAVEHEKEARLQKRSKKGRDEKAYRETEAILRREEKKAAAVSRKDQLMAQARALEEENRILAVAREKLMKIDQYRKAGVKEREAYEAQAMTKIKQTNPGVFAAAAAKKKTTTATMTSTTERDIEAQVLKRISELEVAPAPAPTVQKKKADVRKAREAELARVRAAMKASEVTADGGVAAKSKTDEKKDVTMTQQKADIAREIEQSLKAKEANAAAAAKKKDEGKVVIDERSRIMMNAIDQGIERQNKRETEMKAGGQTKAPHSNGKAPVEQTKMNRPSMSAEQKQLTSGYQTRLLNMLNANRPEGQRSSEAGQSEKEKMIDFLAMLQGAKMAGRWLLSKSHAEQMKVDHTSIEEFMVLLNGMRGGKEGDHRTKKMNDGSDCKFKGPLSKDYLKSEFERFGKLFYEDPFRPIQESMVEIVEWMKRNKDKKTGTSNLDEHVERLVGQHMADVWAGRRPPLHTYKDTKEITTRYNAIMEEIARDPKRQPPRPMQHFIHKREADLARAMIKKELYAGKAFMNMMTSEQKKETEEERRSKQLARLEQAAYPPELRPTVTAAPVDNGFSQRPDDEIENDILASKLFHAKFCRIEANCGYCDCSLMKNLFNHLETCRNDVCTDDELCTRARAIFQHWIDMRKCKIRMCAVCMCMRGQEHLIRNFAMTDNQLLLRSSQLSLAAQLCFIGLPPWSAIPLPPKPAATR